MTGLIVLALSLDVLGYLWGRLNALNELTPHRVSVGWGRWTISLFLTQWGGLGVMRGKPSLAATNDYDQLRLGVLVIDRMRRGHWAARWMYTPLPHWRAA